MYYHAHYWQTGDVLRRVGTPSLFLFAAFSVLLSAMQVTLAVLGPATWDSFISASWGFSIATIVLITGLAAGCVLGVVFKLLLQAQFAI